MAALLKNLKNLLKIAVIAFVIYYVLSRPGPAAGNVRDVLNTILEGLRSAANSAAMFFDRLFQ